VSFTLRLHPSENQQMLKLSLIFDENVLAVLAWLDHPDHAGFRDYRAVVLGRTARGTPP
jgi:hypothetical protein